MPTGAKCLCAGTCLSESPIICLRLVLILFSKVIIFLLNLTFLCLFSFLSILFSPFYSSVTFIKSLTRHLVFLFYTHVSLLYNAMEYIVFIKRFLFFRSTLVDVNNFLFSRNFSFIYPILHIISFYDFPSLIIILTEYLNCSTCSILLAFWDLYVLLFYLLYKCTLVFSYLYLI